MLCLCAAPSGPLLSLARDCLWLLCLRCASSDNDRQTPWLADLMASLFNLPLPKMPSPSGTPRAKAASRRYASARDGIRAEILQVCIYTLHQLSVFDRAAPPPPPFPAKFLKPEGGKRMNDDACLGILRKITLKFCWGVCCWQKSAGEPNPRARRMVFTKLQTSVCHTTQYPPPGLTSCPHHHDNTGMPVIL